MADYSEVMRMMVNFTDLCKKEHAILEREREKRRVENEHHLHQERQLRMSQLMLGGVYSEILHTMENFTNLCKEELAIIEERRRMETELLHDKEHQLRMANFMLVGIFIMIIFGGWMLA